MLYLLYFCRFEELFSSNLTVGSSTGSSQPSTQESQIAATAVNSEEVVQDQGHVNAKDASVLVEVGVEQAEAREEDHDGGIDL